MAPARGQEFTPVQVQKLFFLLDKNVAVEVGGPHFAFEPYHYGPFDVGVYRVLDQLSARGLAVVGDGEQFQMRTYRLTADGQALGDGALSQMAPPVADYVRRASEFVRNTPFATLVSSIYKAYPEMRARSIFRERR
jgi:uncharacterized protein